MYKSDKFTDVTLVSDDKQHKRAHKFILSAVSDVFKSIIDNISEKNSVIYLKGVKYQELEYVLEFIYLGETKFSEEKMEGFLDAATSLEIKELKDIRIEKEAILPSLDEDVNQEIQNVSDHTIDTSDDILLNDKTRDISNAASEEGIENNQLHGDSIKEPQEETIVDQNVAHPVTDDNISIDIEQSNSINEKNEDINIAAEKK